MKYHFCYRQKPAPASGEWMFPFSVYAVWNNGSAMQFLSCHKTESDAQKEVARLQVEGMNEVSRIICENHEINIAQQ